MCFCGGSNKILKSHNISEMGVSTYPCKIEAMADWPMPKNIQELRGFLSLTGYYWRFVQNYGAISKSLTELLKKGQFQWSELAQNAFERLKKAMVSAQFYHYLISQNVLQWRQMHQTKE
jgi:hypothetical protein